jgi:hypothetical protein
VTEALRDAWDGTVIELRPRMLRKRVRAMLYGRGVHAPMRTPLEGVVHAAGMLAGVAILGVGVFTAVIVAL